MKVINVNLRINIEREGPFREGKRKIKKKKKIKKKTLLFQSRVF